METTPSAIGLARIPPDGAEAGQQPASVNSAAPTTFNAAWWRSQVAYDGDPGSVAVLFASNPPRESARSRNCAGASGLLADTVRKIASRPSIYSTNR